MFVKFVKLNFDQIFVKKNCTDFWQHFPVSASAQTVDSNLIFSKKLQNML